MCAEAYWLVMGCKGVFPAFICRFSLKWSSEEQVHMVTWSIFPNLKSLFIQSLQLHNIKGGISKHHILLFYRGWNKGAKKLPIGQNCTTNEMIKSSFPSFSHSGHHQERLPPSPLCLMCVLVTEMLMKCTCCKLNVHWTSRRQLLYSL